MDDVDKDLYSRQIFCLGLDTVQVGERGDVVGRFLKPNFAFCCFSRCPS
jgi:hypothetical protein